jgi:hypothetical protein
LKIDIFQFVLVWSLCQYEETTECLLEHVVKTYFEMHPQKEEFEELIQQLKKLKLNTHQIPWLM